MRGKVLSVIKNPKGVYGFIKTGDGNYYYDTTSLQKGTFLKVGAKVEFDVIPWKGGRTKAVNVKLETIDIEYVVLEEDIRETDSFFHGKGFLFGCISDFRTFVG